MTDLEEVAAETGMSNQLRNGDLRTSLTEMKSMTRTFPTSFSGATGC
jgi:hypothetical protein